MRKMIINFFTIADYEEEELWLREQHRNGWRLEKMTPPCFYTFEACEPEDVIYRLDFKNWEMPEEYMQMLQDFGWEYFAQCFGWLYFRKPADAAESEEDGELFSDNASRAERVRHIVRTRLLPLCIVFLVCVIPNFIRAVSDLPGHGLGVFLTALFGALFVLYIFLIVYCGVKLKMLKDRYLND